MRNNWIAVKNRLPDNNVDVLVYLSGKHSGMVTAHREEVYGHGLSWVINDHNEEFMLSNVAYWMPLPKTPTDNMSCLLRMWRLLFRHRVSEA